jgi:hypothetical protein
LLPLKKLFKKLMSNLHGIGNIASVNAHFLLKLCSGRNLHKQMCVQIRSAGAAKNVQFQLARPCTAISLVFPAFSGPYFQQPCAEGVIPRKPEPKPKLTDAERHKRFVAMAKEVEASDDPKDFEKAFERVAGRRAAPKKSSG